MDITSILVHVDGREESSGSLYCARALAERFGAILLGLGAATVPAIALDPGFMGYDPVLFDQLQADLQARLAQAKTRFEDVCVGFKGERLWRSFAENPVECVARLSRAADLIVACGGQSGAAWDTARPVAVAMASGRPVLVAPPGRSSLTAATVLVAWKDTREARRAIADALPLLMAADEVVVAQACETSEKDIAEQGVIDVVAGLKRHAVKARGKILPGPGAADAKLLMEARSCNAELIVAGAYGHSRLREWIAGGVTLGLLEQDQHFVLLSH